MPAFLDLARGPQVCARRRECVRDNVRAGLSTLIDTLHAKRDEEGLAKLHTALVASIGTGELDAALGDVVLRATPAADGYRRP